MKYRIQGTPPAYSFSLSCGRFKLRVQPKHQTTNILEPPSTHSFTSTCVQLLIRPGFYSSGKKYCPISPESFFFFCSIIQSASSQTTALWIQNSPIFTSSSPACFLSSCTHIMEDLEQSIVCEKPSSKLSSSGRV